MADHTLQAREAVVLDFVTRHPAPTDMEALSQERDALKIALDLSREREAYWRGAAERLRDVAIQGENRRGDRRRPVDVCNIIGRRLTNRRIW